MSKLNLLDIPAAEYHASDFVSHSKLEVFGKDRQMYHWKYVAKKPLEEKPASHFDFGTAAHSLLLEGHECFVQSPYPDFRTNESKAWRASQESLGKIVLKADELATLMEVANAVKCHPLYGEFFNESALREKTIRVQPKGLSFGLQCRMDLFLPEGNALCKGPVIADLKTTRCIEEPHGEWFGKTASNYGYYRQAGFYAMTAAMRGLRDEGGMPSATVFFIVVEKAPPFKCRVFEVERDILMEGVIATDQRITALDQCVTTGCWDAPGSMGAIKFAMPRWHRAEETVEEGEPNE